MDWIGCFEWDLGGEAGGPVRYWPGGGIHLPSRVRLVTFPSRRPLKASTSEQRAIPASACIYMYTSCCVDYAAWFYILQ